MKRALKTVAVLLTALVVAALVTAGAMIQSSRSALERTYHANGIDLEIPTDPESLAEGHRLYRAYGCVSCHLEDGGGRVVMTSGPGYIAAPDLTTAIDHWPTNDLDRLIRHGLRPSGAPVLLMPAHDYWYFDDASIARIIAHARTLPPTGRSYAPSSLTLLGHFLHAIDAFPIVPQDHVDHRARRPPMGDPGSVELGRTLGRMCTGCHGEHLSGGPIPGADVAALGIPENLTPDATGMADWTEENFRAALRTGVEPSGEAMNPLWMPWQDCYQYLTDDEIHSLWLFLREQPPLPFGSR
jgi:hypothetical protein